MKFNVKPENCKFVVNEKNKTIVCLYEGSETEFIDFINDNCKLAPLYSYYVGTPTEKLYKKMLMPNRFVGMAVCGPDDEWDEQTGRLIAFSRMKDKLNKSFFKRANTFFEIIDRWLNESVEILNEIGDKLEKNQDKRHNRIKELVGEKNKEDA